MFEAYFDETGSHDNAEVLSLAGFIFESQKAAEMRTRWQAVLNANDMPFLHMKDFEGGVGPYRHLDDDRRLAILMELHAILYDAAMCGIVISVNKAAFEQSGLGVSALPNPYSLCCYLCLIAVTEALGERRLAGNLSYFFEQGHQHRAITDKMMAYLFRDLDMVVHSFVPKEHGGPIQAADMFAWLHNKYVVNLMNGRDRMRADLKALDANVRCDAACLTTPEKIYAIFERMDVKLPGSSLVRVAGTFGGRPF